MNRRMASLIVVVAACIFNTNTQAQWVKVPLPSPITHVTSIVASGSNLFAGTRGRDVGCVFRSTNNGTSWTAVNSGYPGWVNALAVKDTDLFAATQGHGIFRSTDNGTSWTAVSSGLRDSTLSNVGCLVVSGSNIFAGVGCDSAGTHGGNISLSTNNGLSWTGVSSGLPDTNNVFGTFVSALAVSGTNLYATVSGFLFRSTNNGTSWTDLNFPPGYTGALSLAVIGSNVFAGDGARYFGRDVLLSTNDGTSWTDLSSSIAGAVALQPVNGSNVFAGTDPAFSVNGGRVYLLSKNDTSWTAVNTGLSTDYVYCLDTSGGYLFAGTRGIGGPSGDVGAGVWRRPLSEMITSVEPGTSELPLDFSLSQNYPNPFNPSTTIRYGVPINSFVTLTVYNTLGQQVAQPVNEQQPAGYHEAVFRGDGLASGVYFYRLDAGPTERPYSPSSGRVGSYTSVKKLLLLK